MKMQNSDGLITIISTMVPYILYSIFIYILFDDLISGEFLIMPSPEYDIKFIRVNLLD